VKLAARPNARRRPRSYPRVVKRRTTPFPTKKPRDLAIRLPAGGFAIAIRARAP
jgi:hypothetical protein